MKIAGIAFFSSLFLMSLSNSSLSCTDFRVKANDGSVLITRSMEFALDLNSNVRSAPREKNFTTTAPDGKPGLSWKSKYGYVYLDGLNIDHAVDGLNEVGLSYEALFLPGLAKYQTVDANHDNTALPYMYLGDWALSNFKTVDEVKAAITNVTVFDQKVPGLGNQSFPLHFAFYDNTGKGIVVEYIAGKLNIYDNKIGVMTNCPTYDWQMTNLDNYVHLKPINPNPIKIDGITFQATGQGGGMVGLPGDISPPSRFVKTAVLLSVILTPNTAKDALNTAEHIINNVDIPLGLAREPGNGNYSNELTQWVVFKDLTNKILYYRTYGDLSLRAISLNKIDFSPNAAPLKMSILNPESVKDETGAFINHKS